MSAIHMRDRYYPKYIVMEDSNDAQGFDENGSAVTDVDDFGTVINALVVAAGAHGPCDIKVKEGTYTVPAAGDATIGKMTYLTFSPDAKLDVTGNLTDGVIVIAAANPPLNTKWSITGPVEIDLNGFNGAGIYSDQAGNGHCRATLGGGMFINAVKAGFAGVDLYNTLYLNQLPIWVRTHGIGFRYRRQTDAVHYGNSHVLECRVTNLGSDNVIGLHIQGSGGFRAMNLTHFTRFMNGGTASDEQNGTIGILIEDDTSITFDSVDLEGVLTQVYLDGAQGIRFDNPFIWSDRDDANSYGVRLENDCRACVFDSGLIATHNNANPYVDNSNVLSTSRYMNLLTGGIEVTLSNWDLGNRTRCDKAILWNGVQTFRRGYSENAGVATILNGNNSVVVVHNLAANPITWGGRVTLTGTHAEVAGAIVTATDATDFTIGTPGGGNVTANRDVHWEARITG